MRIVEGNSGTTSSELTFTLHGSQRKRDKEVENVFDEIMAKKVLEPEEGNRYPGTGSTESQRR